jgi:hypothetical protein
MTRRLGPLAGLALAGLALPSGAAAQSAEAHYRLVVVLNGQSAMAGYGTFVDDADIERDGDIRVFSSVQAFTAPPTSPELSEVAYLKVRLRVNCATRMLETLRFSGFAEDGRTIRDGPANDPRPVQVPPGSSAAAMADYVCEGRLDPAKQRVRSLTLPEILDAARRIRAGEAGTPR